MKKTTLLLLGLLVAGATTAQVDPEAFRKQQQQMREEFERERNQMRQQYSYGNLHRETLADILPRIKETETYKRAEYIAASGCKDCRWYHICHGGCLHDGFLASSDFRHKTFLCPAYQRLFAHIEKRLKEYNMIGQN